MIPIEPIVKFIQKHKEVKWADVLRYFGPVALADKETRDDVKLRLKEHPKIVYDVLTRIFASIDNDSNQGPVEHKGNRKHW